MKAYFLTSAFLWLASLAAAQTFPVDTLLYNGDPSRYLNIVIVGDGYTASEQDKLRTDAESLSDLVLKKRPFSNYAGYFNVFLIHVESQESGAIHPKTTPECGTIPAANPKTFFKSTFDFANIHRLVVPTNTVAFMNVLSANVADYDIVFVVVNSPHYGGSGGNFPTATTHQDAGEIAAHEIGHSFAFLADEYWAGGAERPNMTQQSNSSLIKWKNWLNTPNTGIGIYPHSENQSWFRPHQSCLMRQLKNPFCNVCTEAIIERIHAFTDPIVAYTPTTLSAVISGDRYLPFRLTEVMRPAPNTLKINWSLDGTPVAANTEEYILDQLPLPLGSHTLSLTLLDTTELTKDVLHPTSHLSTLTWEIERSTLGSSVISASNQISYTVFPNPTADILTVEVELENADNLRLELTTPDGRILRTWSDGRRSAGRHILRHDMTDLPAGNYWLVLQFGAARQVVQVVRG